MLGTRSKLEFQCLQPVIDCWGPSGFRPRLRSGAENKSQNKNEQAKAPAWPPTGDAKQLHLVGAGGGARSGKLSKLRNCQSLGGALVTMPERRTMFLR